MIPNYNTQAMVSGQDNFLVGLDADALIDPEIIRATVSHTYQARTTPSLRYQQSSQYSGPQQEPLARYMDESVQIGPLRPAFYQQPSMARPVAPHPQAAMMERRDSQSHSLHSYGQTNSSSADSPDAESDLIYEGSPSLMPFNSGHGSMNNFQSYIRGDDQHYLPDLSIGGDHGNSQYLSQVLSQNSFGFINMSQVQGVVDPQEFAYDDEGYVAMVLPGQSNEFVEVDHMKAGGDVNPYHYRDEGFGGSMTDAASIHNLGASPYPDPLTPADTYEGEDADGELEDSEIPATPASDTDYQPESTRSRKRPAPQLETYTRSAVKRHRSSAVTSRFSQNNNNSITRSAPRRSGSNGSAISLSLNPHQCPHCSQTLKDINLLQRHVLKEHTKAFTCVFHFAGCPAVFGTKNEWKRHVLSQHMNFESWVCVLDSCAHAHPHPSSTSTTKSSSASSNSSIKNNNRSAITAPTAPAAGRSRVGAEFNRKDLFTQHLKRMHVPDSCKRKSPSPQALAAWENEIKRLQGSSLRQNRVPPARLTCPVQGCAVRFEGSRNVWDERMEHVGKHLEKMASGGGNGERDVLDQGNDAFLVEWAVKNRVIVGDGRGGYRFPGDEDGDGDRDEDEDAEGESDDE